MIYTAHNGVILALNRVPRRELDALFVQLPQPTPPIKQRPVWGGIEEEYFDHKDATYQDEYTRWLILISDKQLAVMAQGITLSINPNDDLTYNEIKVALGLVGNDKLDYLRYVALNERDFQAVTEAILYMSTVTQKAIDEAVKVFAVEWNSQPLDSWSVKKSMGKYSQFFEHRQVARFTGSSWEEFCALSGPEQSANVAYYRLSNRLEWLEMNANK